MLNSTQTCYKSDGSAQSWDYTPCNPSRPYSMCCRTLEINPGDKTDYCLPNGLCSNFLNDLSDLDKQTYWIESCSDPTWAAEACAAVKKYFERGDGCYIDWAGNVPLGFCSKTMTYCCNQQLETPNCCDASVKTNLMVDLPVASIKAVAISVTGTVTTVPLPTMLSTATSSTVSPGASTATSGTVSPGSTTAVSGSSHGAKGLSVGAGVGIGIASTVVVVLFLMSLAYVFLKRRRGSKPVHHSVTGPYSNDGQLLVGAQSEHKPMLEAPVVTRHEIPSATYRHEMQ